MIITRFLIKEYLKVFFLCLFSFIILLIVTRFQDIATLASMGTNLGLVFLFTSYQIPYILPIALPLSALVASFLLFQNLSNSYELNALRAAGFSYRKLFSPLLLLSLSLSLLNFFIVSEVATTTHLKSRKMLYTLTSENPLILLQNAKLAPLKGAYLRFFPLQNGQEAKDLLLAWSGQEGERLNLGIAKTLKIHKNQLLGENITLISSQFSKENTFLMIENQKEASTASMECAQFLHGGGWKMSPDHLRFGLLQVRIKSLLEDSEKNKRSLSKCYSEIVRRFSFGLAPFSLSFLGIVFGVNYGRRVSRKNTLGASLITTLSLILFFTGKELSYNVPLATLFLILPHLLLGGASLFKLRRIIN